MRLHLGLHDMKHEIYKQRAGREANPIKILVETEAEEGKGPEL